MIYVIMLYVTMPYKKYIIKKGTLLYRATPHN